MGLLQVRNTSTLFSKQIRQIKEEGVLKDKNRFFVDCVEDYLIFIQEFAYLRREVTTEEFAMNFSKHKYEPKTNLPERYYHYDDIYIEYEVYSFRHNRKLYNSSEYFIEAE